MARIEIECMVSGAMKKQTEQRRDRMIGVKVTDAEYERLRLAAFEARKSVSTYVRDVALTTKTKK
jgi:hypothetical protein